MREGRGSFITTVIIELGLSYGFEVSGRAYRKSGDKELPSRLDDLSSVGHENRPASSDLTDTVAVNDDCHVRLSRDTGGVDNKHVRAYKRGSASGDVLRG